MIAFMEYIIVISKSKISKDKINDAYQLAIMKKESKSHTPKTPSRFKIIKRWNDQYRHEQTVVKDRG